MKINNKIYRNQQRCAKQKHKQKSSSAIDKLIEEKEFSVCCCCCCCQIFFPGLIENPAHQIIRILF